MPPRDYVSVSLKEEYIEKIDAYREGFRYTPSRAQVIYEALEALWEQEDFDPDPEH